MPVPVSVLFNHNLKGELIMLTNGGVVGGSPAIAFLLRKLNGGRRMRENLFSEKKESPFLLSLIHI